MKGFRTLQGASAAVVLVAAAAVASVAAAHAQLVPVVHGGTELDSEGFRILVVSAGVSGTGLGLSPSVSVTAYHLRDDPVGGPMLTQTAVAPMVGLGRQWPTGSVSGHVGYLFTDADDGVGAVPGSPAGGGDGVLTAAQLRFWSPAGTAAQATASYNWRTNYVWANLRGSQRLGPGVERAAPAFAVGAEAQFQGELEQEIGYRAFQGGVLGEIQLSPEVRLTGVAGAKTDNRELSTELFPYFKVEFAVFP